MNVRYAHSLETQQASTYEDREKGDGNLISAVMMTREATLSCEGNVDVRVSDEIPRVTSENEKCEIQGDK
jgi:hypothetical protein